MMLIAASIVALIVLQIALWAIVKRFRTTPDGVRPAVDNRAARIETALWLAGAIVVVVALALFARSVYNGQRTQQLEDARRLTMTTLIDNSI